jgi:aerobic carbon-monoxide dehydrogenase medium subunit
MKLPEIAYARPATLADAVALLADPEAKLLAGGQSLIPMMAFRLATPTLLVDIGRIPSLDQISVTAAGVSLGARVRWRDIERSQHLADAHPLLVEGIAHVAHYQVRNRGTVGGSMAHADPAAEMPAIALACNARIEVFGVDGTRSISADEFLVGPLTTALEPTDVLTGIVLPSWPSSRRFAFEEFSRRRGDFALAGACLFYDLDEAGKIMDPHVVVFGATEMPLRVLELEQFLSGKPAVAATFEAAADVASGAIVATDDLHASAAYRASLFGTLVERGLKRSLMRAEAGRGH